MIGNVSEGEFIQRFVLIDRKENFSHEGRKALFEYFEGLEEDTGETIEFDPISICCEYSEYEDIAEFRKEQEGYLGSSEQYEGEYNTLEDVENNTTVIKIEGCERFIINVF